MGTAAGKKYAAVIKETGRGKIETKKRREASKEYKKAIEADKKKQKL